MTDKQNAKQNMLHTLLATCRRYQDVFAGVPVFVNALGELESLHGAIGNAAQQQAAAGLKGASDEKSASIDNLVAETVKTGNALYVLAADTGNAALQAKTRITKTDLYRAHNHDTLAIARNIAAEAALHAAALADYGIGQDDMAMLGRAIDAYDRAMGLPRETIVGNRQVTANVAQLIARADEILRERTDRLMPQFKVKSPDFYAEYFNARNIINTAARHRKNGGDGSGNAPAE